MIRFNILNKNFQQINNNDQRIQITIFSEKEKQITYTHNSNKISGKFSHTIEKSKINVY